MTEQEKQLHEKIALMEGDIRIFVSTLNGVAKTLGIDIKKLSKDNITMILPGVLSRITTSLMTGTFDTQSVANLSALLPILEKYKPLVDDIIDSGNE